MYHITSQYVIVTIDILTSLNTILREILKYRHAICNVLLHHVWLFAVLDMSIEAPPSLKPAKKYSDLSGLPVSRTFFPSQLVVVYNHCSLLTGNLQGSIDSNKVQYIKRIHHTKDTTIRYCTRILSPAKSQFFTIMSKYQQTLLHEYK